MYIYEKVLYCDAHSGSKGLTPNQAFQAEQKQFFLWMNGHPLLWGFGLIHFADLKDKGK